MLVSSLIPIATTSTDTPTMTPNVGSNHSNNLTTNESIQDEENVFVSASRQTNNNDGGYNSLCKMKAIISPTYTNVRIASSTKDDERSMQMEWDDNQDIDVVGRFDGHRDQHAMIEYEHYSQPARRRQRCESMDVSTSTHHDDVKSNAKTSSPEEFDACAALTSLRGGGQQRRRSMSVNDATDWVSQQHQQQQQSRMFIKDRACNVDDVMGKAKKAASTLWLLLHAQTCSLLDQCTYVGCREAKLIHLHLKTCQASMSPTSSSTTSSCPTNHHGCDQARKLLSHYRRCRVMRIAKARNSAMIGLNGSSSSLQQQQRRSCLICSLVARQAKTVLDVVTSKNENPSSASNFHSSSIKGVSKGYNYKKKVSTYGNSEDGTVSFVHDQSLLGTSNTLKMENKKKFIFDDHYSEYCNDTTIITKTNTDHDDPTPSLMMPPPPPRKSVAVDMTLGNTEVLPIASASEPPSSLLNDTSIEGYSHVPRPTETSSHSSIYQYRNQLALLSATAIEMESASTDVKTNEANDVVMEAKEQWSDELETVPQLQLRRRRSNSQPLECVGLSTSENKGLNHRVSNRSFQDDSRLDEEMSSKAKVNHECFGEQFEHDEEQMLPRRSRSASLGGLPLIPVDQRISTYNKGLAAVTRCPQDCVTRSNLLLPNARENCSFLLMLSANQSSSQLPAIGEEDHSSSHIPMTTSTEDGNFVNDVMNHISVESSTATTN